MIGGKSKYSTKRSPFSVKQDSENLHPVVLTCYKKQEESLPFIQDVAGERVTHPERNWNHSQDSSCNAVT